MFVLSGCTTTAKAITLPLNELTAPSHVSVGKINVYANGSKSPSIDVTLSGDIEIDTRYNGFGQIDGVKLRDTQQVIITDVVDAPISMSIPPLPVVQNGKLSFVGVEFTFVDEASGSWREVTPPVDYPAPPSASGDFSLAGAAIQFNAGLIKLVVDVLPTPIEFQLDLSANPVTMPLSGDGTLTSGSLFLEMSLTAANLNVSNGFGFGISADLFTDGTVVPEPGSLGLLGIGGALLLASARVRRALRSRRVD
jgi:hypothetical protein